MANPLDTTAPPIIVTDDGWLLSWARPPLILAQVAEAMVAPLAGTPAALWWSIGDHEVYHFETQIGQIIGQFDESRQVETIGQNVRHLIETCGGPLTGLIGLCRQAGVPFFGRVRMNSHYDIEPDSPLWGRFRREYPDLMIGLADERCGAGSIEHGIRTGLNYVHAKVRQYRAAIICELFERFDIDGVELDFMRHPAFFRVDQAYQHRHLITDMLTCVRQRMQRQAEARGRPIQLAVRVPPTLADSARIGLDVARWIDKQLVDIVVVGGGFVPYQTPIDQFVRAASGRKIDIYGCIESTRYADEKNLRAIASHFFKGGAQGIYLYNFYTMGPEWNRRVLNDLADPDVLAALGKRYELDQTARFTTPYHCAYPVTNIEATFRYANPAAPLPVSLVPTATGRGVRLKLEITDNLETAGADGTGPRATLTLRLDQLGPADVLSVKLNGQPLPSETAEVCTDGWMRQEVEADFWQHFPAKIVEVKREGASVAYPVDVPPLRTGENELEVHLAHASDGQTAGPVLVKGVELLLEYAPRTASHTDTDA